MEYFIHPRRITRDHFVIIFAKWWANQNAVTKKVLRQRLRINDANV